MAIICSLKKGKKMNNLVVKQFICFKQSRAESLIIFIISLIVFVQNGIFPVKPLSSIVLTKIIPWWEVDILNSVTVVTDILVFGLSARAIIYVYELYKSESKDVFISWLVVGVFIYLVLHQSINYKIDLVYLYVVGLGINVVNAITIVNTRTGYRYAKDYGIFLINLCLCLTALISEGGIAGLILFSVLSLVFLLFIKHFLFINMITPVITVLMIFMFPAFYQGGIVGPLITKIGTLLLIGAFSLWMTDKFEKMSLVKKYFPTTLIMNTLMYILYLTSFWLCILLLIFEYF